MHISGKVSAIIPVAIDWLEQSCQLQGLRRKKICREVGWCLWGSLVHQLVFKENGLNTYCLFNPSKLSSLPIIPHSVGPLLVAGDPTHLSIVLYTITLSNVVSSNPQNKLMYIYIISYKNNIQENNENYISLSLSLPFFSHVSNHPAPLTASAANSLSIKAHCSNATVEAKGKNFLGWPCGEPPRNIYGNSCEIPRLIFLEILLIVVNNG